MVDEACKQEGSPAVGGVQSLPVDCPASLLWEICEEAIAESARQPHMAVEFNGPLFGKNLDINYRVPFRHKRVEICGVVFGNREEMRVQIRDFRRLVLEDDFEGSTALSERERLALSALITGAKSDPDLPGLEPVGWLRADPKSHLTLSKRDLEIFQYFFNEPWQMALVLRPTRSGPAKARFILRKPDGSICPASMLRDVIVSAAAESPIVRVEREAPGHEVRGAGPAAAAETWRRPRPRMPAMTLSSLSWILGLVLALGYWWIKSSPQTAIHDAGKRTPAAKADGQKKVEQEAAALWKKWEDELQRKQEIAAPTEKLEKRPPAETEKPDLPKEPPASAAPKKTAVQSQRQKEKEPVSKPRHEVAAVIVVRKPVVPASPVGNRTSLPGPRLIAMPPTDGKKAVAPVLTPPPQIVHQETPAALPRQEQLALSAPPVSVPAAVKNPVAPSPALPVAPMSGRLLWTGHLQKNQTLIIDGANASIGSFTGELPGKPIQLRILPGELADDGIVVYTSSAKSASAVYESPGPQNGWNKTLYALNARRAAEILLVEPPGPQNAWKRLVLRSKSQKASVILVEWTAVR